MSISSQLVILNTTKANIKTQINLKGVEVTDEAFAEYPDKIRQIPNGGGWYESNLILFLEGKLKSVDVPSGATKTGKCSFCEYRQLQTVTLPSTVTEISYWSFKNCTSLTSVNIPSGVTSIGECAFQNCWSLPSITIPNTVTSIGNSAFSGCSALTSITIPNSVISLGEDAFYGCYNCKSITVGSGVTSIGDSAFNGCSKLDYIIFTSTVPATIGSSVFNNTNNCPIYVPDNNVLDYQTATNWRTYSSRIKGISEKP